MEYMTVRQASEKWGRSARWIQVLCGDGRIPGVMRPGRDWLIPANAGLPGDARVKSGKYKKGRAQERREHGNREEE